MFDKYNYGTVDYYKQLLELEQETLRLLSIAIQKSINEKVSDAEDTEPCSCMTIADSELFFEEIEQYYLILKKAMEKIKDTEADLEKLKKGTKK